MKAYQQTSEANLGRVLETQKSIECHESIIKKAKEAIEEDRKKMEEHKKHYDMSELKLDITQDLIKLRTKFDLLMDMYEVKDDVHVFLSETYRHWTVFYKIGQMAETLLKREK